MPSLQPIKRAFARSAKYCLPSPSFLCCLGGPGTGIDQQPLPQPIRIGGSALPPMTFQFANPLFVSLLPLAGLPILFHLFFRMKKRPQPFPTLMFFHRLDPQLNARRRLREYLVLLLRCLLILFLVLMLAHPKWLGIGRQDSLAVVVVLDNSGSMSGPGINGPAKSREAIKVALEILGQLRPGDQAGLVLLVDDPLSPIPDGLTTNPAVLKKALPGVRETEASGSVVRAIERAISLAESSPASHGVIHIISDLQEEKWNSNPIASTATKAEILVHKIGSPTAAKANMSIRSIRLSDKTVRSGRRIPCQIDLASDFPGEASIRLCWADDSGNKNTRELLVPGSSGKTATILLEPQNPGLRWVWFWIEGDEFTADNRAGIAFSCTEKTVVFFTGPKNDFGLLPVAISPTSDGRLSGLMPKFGSLLELPATLTGSNVFPVLTWDLLAQAGKTPAIGQALKNFLEAGGHGLVVPGLNGSRGPLAMPGWLGTVPESFHQEEKGLPLSIASPSASLFNDLREADGGIGLRNIKVFNSHFLRIKTNDLPLLRVSDEGILLAECPVGRGSLLVSGLAFDPAWSNLPLKPAFLALAQGLVSASPGSAHQLANSVAGEPLREAGSGQVHIQTLAGSSMDWQGRLLMGLPRAGIYRLASGTNLIFAAVQASEKEGRRKFISGDRLPALGSLACSVLPYSGSLPPIASGGAPSVKSLDLALPLLAMAWLAWMLESWLANRPPLKPKPVQAPQQALVSNASWTRS